MKKHYLLIGVLCVIIASLITVQVKTVDSWDMSTSRQSTKEKRLTDSILKANEKNEKLQKERDKVLAELEEIRATIAEKNENATEVEKKITEINKLLGYTDVKGEGIVITVKDGIPEDMEGYEYSVDYLSGLMVHDGDLKAIVNELFNAGAQAVSINGQRVVAPTAINCMGSIITVNGEKLGSPFVIKAIGSKSDLYGGVVRPGGYLENMEFEGVSVEVKENSNIKINKYTGVYNTEHLKRVD